MPRLQVLVGPTPSSLVPISELVNTDKPHTIRTNDFEGQLVVNIKNYKNPQGKSLQSDYFQRADRKEVTWSFQVQGRFLHHHSADDILFGNTFDRALQLPWGSGAVLKFMSYMDPTLEHDFHSTSKAWALSPLISTMPHFAHKRVTGSDEGPPFPPKKSIEDDLSHIHLMHTQKSGAPPTLHRSTSSSSVSSDEEDAAKSEDGDSKPLGTDGPHSLNLRTAKERRTYFRTADHRNEVRLGPHDVLTMDFCYGYLEFDPSLALRIPGGVSFDLMKFWDGQPVRYTCCERKKKTDMGGGDPWGKIFWCIQIELAEEEDPKVGVPEERKVEENAPDGQKDGKDISGDID